MEIKMRKVFYSWLFVLVFLGYSMGYGYELAYSTFLGGSLADIPTAIAVDSAGNVYMAGYSQSKNLPVTMTAYTTTHVSQDVFVAKINPDGSGLEFSVYMGGESVDEPFGIAVDAQGNCYVTGYTSSSAFPVTAGAYSTSSSGGFDAFLFKLNPTGTDLVYSTYIGGSKNEQAFGVAVDPEGNAYITGYTLSGNFPTTENAYSRTSGGGYDGFVSKINSTGTGLVYSTYLGSEKQDSFTRIAVDDSGCAYVTGYSNSTSYPTTAGAYSRVKNLDYDVVVTKLNAAGTGLVYSTYVGGASMDVSNGIALDSAGNAYIAGYTYSADFPVSAGAYQASTSGGQDTFVTKLNPEGSALVYSTYVGGNATDYANGIAVDDNGCAYVAGYTNSSTSFPLANSYQGYKGTYCGTLYKLNDTGTGLVFSTYLGGDLTNCCVDVAADPAKNAYIVGYTTSTNFPVTAGAYSETKDAGIGFFITKIASESLVPVELSEFMVTE